MTKFKFGDKVWHKCLFGNGIYYKPSYHGSDKPMCYVLFENYGLKVVRLSNITKAADWIQCSERLPKHGEMVLVFNGNSIEIDALAIGEFDFECWCDSVTHWMPLPAPPTDDTQ